jgi:hypothetical protein
MTSVPSTKLRTAIKVDATIYGRQSLLILIPVLIIAIISEFSASLLVKKITAMKTNKAEKRFE